MNEENKVSARPLGFAALLAISFGLFNVGFIIEQTIRWTNPLEGLFSGLAHVLFFGASWGIYLLPWSLLIWTLYRWRKWQRFRTYWVLAPAVAVAVLPLIYLVLDPPFAANRFQKFAQTTLPENRQNFRCYLSGGGISDYGDTYYFETTPEEVERLIQQMKLTGGVTIHARENTHVSPLPEGPDFFKWVGPIQYWRSEDGWNYYLITDTSRTKVYIDISCI